MECDSKWSDLFPTTASFIVFILYMALFINQGIVVTASQQADSSYTYNTVTVVLLTEATKLLVSALVYLKAHSFSSLCLSARIHAKVLLLYMVPAFLYCLYNNLAFVNLKAFDPTTYFLLLQLRVVVTGVIFQVVFQKRLSQLQWCSLLILTAGCVVKQLYAVKKPTADVLQETSFFDNIASVNTIWLLIQVLSSCLAGVYNEKLLKDVGAEVHILVQNVFMYIDSMICNAAVLLFQGELVQAFEWKNLEAVMQPMVLIIIANNAAIGIVTSFFLKSLNSILKTFASALELMFTAVLSFIIFGIPIGWSTVIAITLVTYATILYARNPVVNKGRLELLASQCSLQEPLLDADDMGTSKDPAQV